MKAIVCTLFEQEYHLGVAMLVNSLCQGGYNGTIYAGFRGSLPSWAKEAAVPNGERCWEMEVTPEVRIVFLGLATRAHFTNYKPDFMLHLETIARAESDAVIYCDPDIVFNGRWRYVEEWLTCGVALCEDVNSPLRENNPRRVGWERFFGSLGLKLGFRGDEYANGGFVGLRWEHRQLLVTWQEFLVHVARSLGGSDVVGIGGGRNLKGQYGFADCFRQPDQDALNAALEAHPEIPVSFLGPLAMGFVGGHALLPHALGGSKPWRRRFLREAIKGRPPRIADKAFWKYADGPLQPFSRNIVRLRRFELLIGAGIGRFMRRH